MQGGVLSRGSAVLTKFAVLFFSFGRELLSVLVFELPVSKSNIAFNSLAE